MQIVNLKKTDDYDEYGGRGSIFGNPFEIEIDGTREHVIQRYRKWFNLLIKDRRFKTEVLKLRNKKVACFCAPLPCHLEVIKEYLDNHHD